MSKISLFSQIISLLPRDRFKQLVHKYRADFGHKGISSWTHLVSMLFCQLARAESVRDISFGLRSVTGDIAHLGVGRAPSKSSVSYINRHRPWKLFADYYFAVLEHLQAQHAFRRPRYLRIRRRMYLMDASLLPLCLEMFDWAHYRRRKGAAKIHLTLDYQGCLPVFADLTAGKTHEITRARQQHFPSASVVVFDRGYADYSWLGDLDSSGVFFVTRAKANMDYRIVSERPLSHEQARADWEVELLGARAKKAYVHRLRRILWYDPIADRELVFLTNHLSWTASTVAAIYRERWRIEVFFKHLKQHLRIKSFVGTSQNGVMIQFWTALLAMLLLTWLKEKARFGWHLSNLIHFLRLHLLAKVALFELLDHPVWKPPERPTPQPDLFGRVG